MEIFRKSEFRKLVNDNEGIKTATRNAIFDLLKFTEKREVKIRGGKDNKTFHYMVRTKEGTKMLFYCDSFGRVDIALGNFNKLLKPADVSRFLRKLGNPDDLHDPFHFIHRFEHRRLVSGTQHFMIEETLIDHNVMEEFKEAILWLERKISLAETGPQKGSKRSVPYKEKREKEILEYFDQIRQRKRERKSP